MATVEQIQALARLGWSQRRIAKHLGIDRGSVARYVRELTAPKPAISTAGSGPPGEPPSEPIPPPSPGRRSECEPFRNLIVEGIEKGQSAEVIWRDLKLGHGFEHSYESVKRFVRKLKAGSVSRDPVRRMECLPGEEAQVDFGVARTIRNEKGKLTQSNILRVTLSFSRKGYTETVTAQSTDCFIRALENSFRHFGGVPATLVIDNLKAAVKKADWVDPELNPKFAAFARHYGVAVIPTRPYTPQHKGKVESDVGYVKRSALKGREFSSLNEQNRHLAEWEKTVADTRIHGTTRKQVGRHFFEHEKPALQALPVDLFPSYQESKRKVHRDGYVEVQRSYYAVPPEFIGREVWVRWDTKTVRVLDDKLRAIISHVRLEPGKFSECLGARGKPGEKLTRSSCFWVAETEARIGETASQWAAALARQRPEMSIRVIQGLLGIASSGKHRSGDIEEACAAALDAGDFTLGYLKRWLESKASGQAVYRQEQLELLEEHEMIRSMDVYQQYLDEYTNKPPTH